MCVGLIATTIWQRKCMTRKRVHHTCMRSTNGSHMRTNAVFRVKPTMWRRWDSGVWWSFHWTPTITRRTATMGMSIVTLIQAGSRWHDSSIRFYYRPETIIPHEKYSSSIKTFNLWCIKMWLLVNFPLPKCYYFYPIATQKSYFVVTRLHFRCIENVCHVALRNISNQIEFLACNFTNVIYQLEHRPNLTRFQPVYQTKIKIVSTWTALFNDSVQTNNKFAISYLLQYISIFVISKILIKMLWIDNIDKIKKSIVKYMVFISSALS